MFSMMLRQLNNAFMKVQRTLCAVVSFTEKSYYKNYLCISPIWEDTEDRKGITFRNKLKS